MADFDSWLAHYRSDPDAVRLKLDPDSMRAETAPRIGAWNALGRDLCARFLAVATDRAGLSPAADRR
jgi:hypothetical protein